MKAQQFYSVFIFLIICTSFCFSSTTFASVNSDTTNSEKPGTLSKEIANKIPDYKQVDVVVECDWDKPDKYDGVNVFVNLNPKNPHLILVKGKQNKCEICLIKGVLVKNSSHETGKLLNTYGTK